MLVGTDKCLSGTIWSYLALSCATCSYPALSGPIWSYLELSGLLELSRLLELSGAIWGYLERSLSSLRHIFIRLLYYTYAIFTVCSFAHTNAYLALSENVPKTFLKYTEHIRRHNYKNHPRTLPKHH